MTALEDRMGAGKIGLDESIADASSFECSGLHLSATREHSTLMAPQVFCFGNHQPKPFVTHGQVIDWGCWWMRTEIGRLSAVFK
jgi:hypothetical protein